MNPMNCIKGMKVTTTGNPSSGERRYSDCCKHEKEKGFIYVYEARSRIIEVSNRLGSYTDFRAENVHPYFGGKK